MSDKNNVKRKIRRIGNNKASEMKSKNAQIQLDEKDKAILGNAEGIRNQSITNTNKISNIEVQITAINRNLQQFEQNIQQFEQKQINPKFDELYEQNEILTELVWDINAVLIAEFGAGIEFTAEQLKALGFEVTKVEDAEVEIIENTDGAEDDNGE